MKTSLLIAGLILMAFAFNSCEKDNNEPFDNGNNNDTINEGNTHEQSSDYLWDNASSITLNGSSISSNAPGVTINGTFATITAEGNYIISGTLNNGAIIVDTDNNSLVRLILDGVAINNDTGPAILIEKSRKTIINLAQGTLNNLSDGASYANPDGDPNATLYSKSDMTLFGAGTLTVNGNFNDGINSRDGLIVHSGNINITAMDDGLQGKDYLIIKDGSISVNTGGDGLKSANELHPEVGYILIEGGEITAQTNGDGIYAFHTVTATGGSVNITTGGGHLGDTSGISQEGIKGLLHVDLQFESCIIDAVDHAIKSNHTIDIHSGSYSLRTAKKGLHSDSVVSIYGGDLTIDRGWEGIESHHINIFDGNLNIHTIDDCLNATAGYDVDHDDNSLININGGYMVFNTMRGDGIDSNGGLEMTEGTVIIHGPALAPQAAVDCNGVIHTSGGFLIASGSNSEMTQAPDTTSVQNAVLIMFANSYSDGTIFHLQDEFGDNIVTFEPLKSYHSMLLSSPDLVIGRTYKIFIDGTSSGTEADGLYADGEYTPGTELATFTIDSKVTSLFDI